MTVYPNGISERETATDFRKAIHPLDRIQSDIIKDKIKKGYFNFDYETRNE